jgi:hypothetical protein
MAIGGLSFSTCICLWITRRLVHVAPAPPVTDVKVQNSSVADVEDSDMDGRTSGPPLLFEARDDGAALLRARASMSDENIEVWEGCGV